MQVQLRAVTYDNFDAVVELQLLKHQEDYLSSNCYSIAQSKFDPHYHPRAIYADDDLVGFLMYNSFDCEVQHQTGIHRFMIDQRHQGKGLGRQAMQLVLDEIKAQPLLQRITICYHPTNPLAKPFYASLGFIETGLDEEGEMIAEILINKAQAAV
ncbi:MAG: GNAT family N-acetyltransferase [Burkholderiales bacterium]|nr:GNAT family N-acetyltransferase [Burkholderiales bacterium]